MNQEKIDEISDALHALANDLVIIQSQMVIMKTNFSVERLEKIQIRADLAVRNLRVIQDAWRICHHEISVSK